MQDPVEVLIKAMKYDKPVIVKMVIEQGLIDSSGDEFNLLTFAVEHNSPAVVAYFLDDLGWDVNTGLSAPSVSSHCALMYAIRRGYGEVVQVLLDYGVRVHERSCRVVKCAAQYEQDAIMDSIIKHTADQYEPGAALKWLNTCLRNLRWHQFDVKWRHKFINAIKLLRKEGARSGLRRA